MDCLSRLSARICESHLRSAYPEIKAEDVTVRADPGFDISAAVVCHLKHYPGDNAAEFSERFGPPRPKHAATTWPYVG